MPEFVSLQDRRHGVPAILGTKSSDDRTLDSAGEPLEAGVRREMEARLGADFTSVRVHTGTEADESARSLDARAYTMGVDVVFRAGQYAPSTPVGQYLLAHELTHVVQQGPDAAPFRTGPGPAAAEREAHDVAGGNAHARRNPATAGHIQRFDSFEHIQLGDTAAGGPTGYLLLECHARDLPAHATPTVGWPPDWIRRYHTGTPDQKRAITQGLTYGEILALSGDMYADIDPGTMATSVVGSMRRINRASLVEIYDLIPVLHSQRPEDYPTEKIESITGTRYLSLAKRNISHFSRVDGGRNNIDTWREGHAAALVLAAAGNANGAWAMNAAADHFLTDAFAAGHLLPDRANSVIGSKLRHDLDNENGVPVRNLRGDRWIAYGDDHLNDVRDSQRAAQKAFEASAPDVGTAFAALARSASVVVRCGHSGTAPPWPGRRGSARRSASATGRPSSPRGLPATGGCSRRKYRIRALVCTPASMDLMRARNVTSPSSPNSGWYQPWPSLSRVYRTGIHQSCSWSLTTLRATPSRGRRRRPCGARRRKQGRTTRWSAS